MSLQLKVLIICILLYLIWAIISHKKDKSLTMPILLEYLLIAVLVLIIFMGTAY